MSSDTNGKGLYYRTVTDDGKATYYFRGAVENNYVKFANQIWRIIRINEDGSIRMITQNSVTSMAFNSKNTDNAYVGYMYGTAGSSTYANTHANTNDSDIKKYLDTWYEENLKTNYSSYLADSGFCNDRSLYSGTGTGTTETYYGSYNRLRTNKKPQFACPNGENDLFTLKGGTKGNKALDYPIGLITADEIAYAGNEVTGNAGSNYSYYLYNETSYWTMTPHTYSTIYGNLSRYAGNYFEYHLPGQIYYNHVSYNRAVRPVINLKSTIEVAKGNGTSTNPYVIQTS